MKNLTKRRQDIGTAIVCASDGHHMQKRVDERDWSFDNKRKLNLFPSEGVFHNLDNELIPVSSKFRQQKPPSQQN